MKKTTFLVLLCLPLLSFAGSGCGIETGERHPEAAPETAQFAFLLGDFTVQFHVWLGDRWSPPQPGTHARWNGRYGLDGKIIVDEWLNPDPALNPDWQGGINVRLFDAAENIWKMMWISTNGRQVQDLRAEVRDGRLTMWQVHPERPDFKADFTVVDDDNWYRTSYTHDDEGNWVKQYKLAATRVACDG